MVSTITRYNLDATTPTGILAINAAKVIMTFEADTADAKVQLFYNTGGFADNAYIDFSDGTIAVFDADPLTGKVPSMSDLFALMSAGTGTLAVWTLSCEGGY
tara:strand:- start:1973 stop:2278 length:306 start_codon:yes stop_codon:yes gene_type:complete